jgi:hypothetical protein
MSRGAEVYARRPPALARDPHIRDIRVSPRVIILSAASARSAPFEPQMGFRG